MGSSTRTRVEIVGALLREGKVTPEEAAVLLEGGQQQVFIPLLPLSPWPLMPEYPHPFTSPYIIPNEPQTVPLNPPLLPTIICMNRSHTL